MEFNKTFCFYFFSVKPSPPVIINNSETMSQLLLSTRKKHSSRIKIQYPCSPFLYVSKIVFGLQKIVVLGNSTRPTTKESFPFGGFFFLEHFLRTFTFVQLCLFSRQIGRAHV